ncbi:hypothetical protein [Roseateles sp.]
MVTSARFKFTATLLVSVLGFVLALIVLPASGLLDEPLVMLAPQR